MICLQPKTFWRVEKKNVIAAIVQFSCISILYFLLKKHLNYIREFVWSPNGASIIIVIGFLMPHQSYMLN